VQPLDPPARTILDKRNDPLLLAVLAIAFAVRLQGIDDDGFWLDEITSLRDAAHPLGVILLGKGQPGHPPLYYLLLKGWTALFGTSETTVRLLSAISGTAAVGATYALFRALHGRAAGFGASLLLALSFHHIVFSQEARNYALFGFLAVLSTHMLWRALAEGGRKRWAIYVVCALLMAYTHHQAYVVLFGGAMGAVLAATLGRMRKGALEGLAIADIAIVIAAVPSILLYLMGLGGGGTAKGYGYWQPRVSWQGLVDLAAVWTPGGPLLAPGSYLYSPNPPRVPSLPWLPVMLLLPAVVLALAWVRARPDGSPWDPPSPRSPPTLFHSGTLYLGIGAFLVIASMKPIWHVRYVIVFLPFFLGGLGALLAATRSRYARGVVLLAFVGLSLPGLVREKQVPGRTPWRETAAYLSSKENAAVCVIGPRFLARPLGWYFKRPFGVFPGQAELVPAAVRAAEAGASVLVVYCDAHSPPDPDRLAAQELARTLALRGVEHFGSLHVFEFRKRR